MILFRNKIPKRRWPSTVTPWTAEKRHKPARSCSLLLFFISQMFLLITSIPMATLQAQEVSIDEAFTVAENWLTLIIHEEGMWGASETAHVGEVREYRTDDQLLGYFCKVEPRGYIVVSINKNLAPVRTYSETCDIDPESDEYMESVFKLEMARTSDEMPIRTDQDAAIQTRIQSEAVVNEHQTTWQLLSYDSYTYAEGLDAGTIVMNYQGGKPPLLASSWHQGDPYNLKCPAPGFLSNCGDDHCPVGCTPLAGAQIMRYWAWPPDYDWLHMADRYDFNDVSNRWEDEDEKLLTPTHINAVSKLCHDVGVKAGADYCVLGFGCQTFAFLANNTNLPPISDGKDLLDAFEDHFRYHDNADEEIRFFEDADEWFDIFRGQLNMNWPVPYELGTGFHTVVCDGWKIVGSSKYLHLNYGWGVADNGWYIIDTQPERGRGEHMIIRLYPEPVVSPIVTANIVGMDYRYFAYDTLVFAEDAFFICPNGQFLPGVKLTVQPGGKITFGARLFSIKGTSAASIDIKLGAATMTMYEGAEIRFH